MELNGFIYALVSAFFFGSAGIFIKQGYAQNLSPSELLILQYIIAGVILFLICLIKYRHNLKLTKNIMGRLVILGAGNTLMTICLYSAMAYLDIAVATMLIYTYPAMVALFSFSFYNEKISKVKIAAILGTFTGCMLVINIWNGYDKPISIIGIIFGALSAVFYSFMNIYSKSIVEMVPPLVITFYTTLVSLIVLLPYNFKFVVEIFYLPVNTIANAGVLAFFCEIIPLTLLYTAIKHIGPVKTSIISTIELPVSAVTAFMVMGEKLFPTQYAGIALVLLSIVALRRD